MKIAAALLFLLFFSVPQAFAAQSTADVSASKKLKQSARTEILGSRADDIVPQEEYVIGHGDILSVSIYGEGDMAASANTGISRGESSGDASGGDAPRFGGQGVRVMMDGRMSLKHVGDVEVVGMTLTELADYLKVLYATIYDDPIVTTTLEQSNSLRYTIMGNIASPGNLFLDSPLTLVQSIARSGGFTEWANSEITVVREKVHERDAPLFKGNTLEFDYDDFISGKKLEKNILIQNGDIIIVN
ncbi:MAG TPA: polysaccharide biosynthesis/export family protein [Desulfopila sp.]|nr:polysaccharide biosynthesis/export family protein [Desulfopila sp.]